MRKTRKEDTENLRRTGEDEELLRKREKKKPG